MRATHRILILIDQAIYGLSSVALTIVAARVLPVDQFGIFAAVILTITTAVGAIRVYLFEPLYIRLACVARVQPSNALTMAAQNRSLIIALVCGCTVGLIGLVALQLSLLVAIACIGAIMGPALQDAARCAFLLSARPLKALATDLVVVGVQLAVLMWLGMAPTTTALTLLVGAGLAALASAAPTVIWLVLRPRQSIQIDRALPQTFARKSLQEYVLGTATTQVVLWTATAQVGSVVAASLRGADSLFAPLRLATQSLGPILLPAAARAVRGGCKPSKSVLGMSAVLATSAMFLTLLLMIVPERIGAQLLGESWMPARDLIPILGVGYALSSISAVLILGLKAMGRAQALVWCRVAVLPIGIALGVTGALVRGAEGMAMGAALTSFIACLTYMSIFLRHKLEEASR